jgi:hypothetical protein
MPDAGDPGTKCPYCNEPILQWSRDHIFPQFLGGTRCVPACKPCNEIFGATLEAKAASILHPLHIVLNSWGLPIAVEGPRWREAYQIDGQSMDLRVGPGAPIMTSSKPIIPDMLKGTHTAEFRTIKEAQQFRKQLDENPRVSGVKTEVRVDEVSTPGIPVTLKFGLELRQIAVKMCIALSRLMPTLELAELTRGQRALRSEENCKSSVGLAFLDYCGLDSQRPELAHTIYVERGQKLVYGVLQFFGAFQLFCRLGVPSGAPEAAIVATLDPLNGKETFSEIPPLNLEEPPEFYSASSVPNFVRGWHRKLSHGAAARGATKDTDVNLYEVRLQPRPIEW